MLLMLTVGLVAAAAALLGLGFAENSLGLVYAAIACAAAGVVATAVLGRVARRRAVAALPPEPIPKGATGAATAVAAGPGTPAPASPASDGVESDGATAEGDAAEVSDSEVSESEVSESEGGEATPARAAAPTDPPDPPGGDEPDDLEGWDSGDDLAGLGEPGGTGDRRGAGRAAVAVADGGGAGDGRAEPEPDRPDPEPDPEDEWDADRLDGWDDDGWDDNAADEKPFPIEDYDRLTVPEVLPRLGGLDPEGLREVLQRGEMTKGRGIILGRIDSLLARPAEPVDPAEPPEG